MNPNPEAFQNTPSFLHRLARVSFLNWSLTQSSLVRLDIEWKPVRTHQSSFLDMSLLQIACQLGGDPEPDLAVFIIDLLSIPLLAMEATQKNARILRDLETWFQIQTRFDISIF
ncbi:hypothetical protein AHAS_Ahas02G0109700 [Arachis hypogaea]